MLEVLLWVFVWWLLPSAISAGLLARFTDMDKGEIIILSTAYPCGLVILVLNLVIKEVRKE